MSAGERELQGRSHRRVGLFEGAEDARQRVVRILQLLKAPFPNPKVPQRARSDLFCTKFTGRYSAHKAIIFGEASVDCAGNSPYAPATGAALVCPAGFGVCS